MSSKQPHITVEITHEDLWNLLSNQLRPSPVKEALMDLINAHMGEHFQKEQLYKTLVGVSIVPQGIEIGDQYWVENYNLQSWNFDKAKMKEEHLIVEGYVLCTVGEINPYKESPIGVTYTYIDGTGKLTVGETFLGLKTLKKKEPKLDLDVS
jgi:hypothetical protein